MNRFTHFLIIFQFLFTSFFLNEASAIGNRFESAHFRVEIEGVDAGQIKSVKGGKIKSEVIVNDSNLSYSIKQVGTEVNIEPITMEVELDLNSPISDWISSVLNGNPQKKNGVITAYDVNNQGLRSIEFYDAVLAEIGLPILDTSHQGKGFVTVKLQPEYIRINPASLLNGPTTINQNEKNDSTWMPSNFRVEIDGLPCDRITAINPLNFKLKLNKQWNSSSRIMMLEPTGLKIPDLNLSIEQTDFTSWYQWFEDFVIRGNNSSNKELSGRIIFLAADQQTELGYLDLKQVGIFSLSLESDEKNKIKKGNFGVALYVEEMSFIQTLIK